MREILITPFLLGLSTGIYCFSHCVPFVAPIMVSEPRERRENFFVIFKLLLGRLLGYLCFGVFFGFLGSNIQSASLDLIVSVAMMLLSLILVLHALGLAHPPRFFSLCSKIQKHTSKIPLFMGFLMGVHICPALVMSLTYVFTLKSVLKGIIYFFMFFLATSIYFLPLVYVGRLGKSREFQLVGRLSALIVGVSFFVYNLLNILRL